MARRPKNVLQFPPTKICERGRILLADARDHAEAQAPLAGFMVLTWDDGGTYKFSADVGGAKCPIPLTLLPAWVEEIVRRELLVTRQIHRILNQDYEIDPSQPG